MNEKLNIGIVLGSTRDGRVSPQVGQWVKAFGDARGDAEYEIVDIKDYDLPFIGTTKSKGLSLWQEKIASLDAFIFVVQEYNHSMSGALKNAFDVAPQEAWNNKAAGIVSYGSAGGARASEHVRNVLSELMVASVRSHVLLSIFNDFENWTTFKPQALHETNMKNLFDQVNSWATALKTVRTL